MWHGLHDSRYQWFGPCFILLFSEITQDISDLSRYFQAWKYQFQCLFLLRLQFSGSNDDSWAKVRARQVLQQLHPGKQDYSTCPWMEQVCPEHLACCRTAISQGSLLTRDDFPLPLCFILAWSEAVATAVIQGHKQIQLLLVERLLTMGS